MQPFNPVPAEGESRFAHYCNDKTVRITDSARPIGGLVVKVAGKREARAIAEQYNARPWNF